MQTLLSPGQIEGALAGLPQWRLNNSAIERWFEFSSFTEAIDFVGRVAEIAEKLNHHPDIDIRFRKVRLSLTTYSACGLTQLDITAAALISRL